MKTGRLSKAEWDFIERNADLMSPEQIAKELDRELDPIKNYLIKIGKSLNKQKDVQTHVEYTLSERAYWPELKQQFTEKELELFASHFGAIVTQFRQDILATEELQIIDMIKLDILMNRALKEQKDCIDSIEQWGKEIAKLRKARPTDPREIVEWQQQIFDIEKNISILKQDKESISKEFKDLQDRKDKAWKSGGASREKRVNFAEGNKVTFSSLCSRLLKDYEFRDKCSYEMSKFKLAIEQEKKRLAEFRNFGDQADRCLLNEDTVTDQD